ncbi:DUF3053 family protein [Clostridium estertheticum]|uniref:hypothetical protein n=1 Tax=Clostridium estertheticum TaxID=238834 RepID=UPI001C7D7EC4|nr:hypothetical protein [Clostridium estertheticum]MBX4261381.1 hypothetical protein [Clostridium estertheticum]WLC70649.1 DUF3053 family protein [Clostridium estertheticum]
MNENNMVENELHEQGAESKIFTILAIIFFLIGTIISIVEILVQRSAYLKTANISSQLGYIIGRIIAVVLIAYIVRLIFKKKKGCALMIFSIVFMLASSVTTANAINKRTEEISFNKVAMHKLISMSSDYAAGKDLSSDKLENSKYGNMAPLLDLCNQYFISYQKLSANMKSDVSKAHVETLLSADTFSTPAKTKDTQERLKTLTSGFGQFETDANKISKKMNTDINNVDIPQIYKEDVAAGFEKGQLQSSAMIKKYIAFETSFIKKINDSVTFMVSEKGNYEVKNNMVYFTSPATLSKFNKNMNDIQKLAIEETTLINDMKKTAEKQLDYMKTLDK